MTSFAQETDPQEGVVPESAAVPTQRLAKYTPPEGRKNDQFSLDRLTADGLIAAMNTRAANVLLERRAELAQREAEIHQQIEQIDGVLPNYQHPELP